MYGYIYKTTNLVNGKIYIGQHKSTQFDKLYCGSGSLFLKALEKYGRDSFTCEMLEACNSFEELNEREKYYISLYDSMNKTLGYNLTEGGQGISGYKHDFKSKRKISVNNAKYWSGKKLSSVTIDKLSKSHIGKQQSIETRLKRSEALRGHDYWGPSQSPMKGKSHSVESRKKMSISHLGQEPSNKGSLSSIEVRQKVSKLTKEAMSRPEVKAKLSSWIRSDQMKSKISSSIKGRKFVTNGVENHQVKIEDLDKYLSAGYKLGLMKGLNHDRT